MNSSNDERVRRYDSFALVLSDYCYKLYSKHIPQTQNSLSLGHLKKTKLKKGELQKRIFHFVRTQNFPKLPFLTRYLNK